MTPTVTPRPDCPMFDDEVNHPAFGQISAHRVSGGIDLYGSDFTHDWFIEITIRESIACRDTTRTSYMPRDELISVALSESQWATFVSSLNVGSGPCCTIQHVLGKDRPKLPAPNNRVEDATLKMKARIDSLVEEIDAASAEIDGMKLPKGKTARLHDLLEGLKRELSANIPYYVDSFREELEEGVEKAKVDIHGYLTSHNIKALT